MHGCKSGPALLVNAEVDSMGGVVDGGVGIDVKTSPHRAAIEKAQAELRQEYDVREERRRELEFLEKGGNPLDFKFGIAASASVQSTSLKHHHEQFVTSEAKGSFALTASPHGDSVESSGRPEGPAVCDPNTADNFDGENELLEGERSSTHISRKSTLAPSEQSSQIEGSQHAKESEDSAIFRPYARRNRSKSNRDGLRGGPRDSKGSVTGMNNLKDHNKPPMSKLKAASANGDVFPKDLTSVSPMEDGLRTHVKTRVSGVPEDKLGSLSSKSSKENQYTSLSRGRSHANPAVTASVEANTAEERELAASADIECPPFETARRSEDETTSGQPNGFIPLKLDKKVVLDDGKIGNAALGTKGIDSESSCTQISVGLDVNNDSDICTNIKNIDSNGNATEQASDFERKTNLSGSEVRKENDETQRVDGDVTNEKDAAYQNHSRCHDVVKVMENTQGTVSDAQNVMKDPLEFKGVKQNDHTTSMIDKGEDDVLGDNANSNKESFCSLGLPGPSVQSDCDTHIASRQRGVTPQLEPQNGAGECLKLSDEAHEDSILEEARVIAAKHKHIQEFSVCMPPPVVRQKSHWDFVLEEMAWLANDFVQERLWKITAAAQLCGQIAHTSQLRLAERAKQWKMKSIARNLAKSVMQFWHTAKLLLDSHDHGTDSLVESVESEKDDSGEVSEDKVRYSEKKLESSIYTGILYPGVSVTIGIQRYVMRFLKHNRTQFCLFQAEGPITPDRISDLGSMDVCQEHHLTEGSLYYLIPSCAMEAYRKSVESQFIQFEKTGSGIQEEVETSMCDTAAEFGSEDIINDEEEGETSSYYLPGVVEGYKSSKSGQKKHKNPKSCTRTYEVGEDMPYGHFSSGSQQAVIMGKRPASLNVVTIAKRMRTSNRQRVASPYGVGVTGTLQAQAKTDASSGDTNSFQDDQSTLHWGPQIQRSMEVESVGDFEKHLPYECAETSFKLKKKKAKHLGSTLDQGWQLESAVRNEPREYSKRRLDGHHFESNGSSGLYVQHNAKKPKMVKQSLDNTFDNITPMSGSIPSPAASQMSNMSNPSKLIKVLGGRDRGRKTKPPKICAGQLGSGSPWTQFEDQALVVLVHDMGPNWELVSDAMNSTLQFKCVFRKPKECKERHKILMDKSAADGADSAEDSGSSLSYPFQIPGIPKGSARQLFQRLQGPMEEDTIKSHFEKLIKIGQKQHLRRNQIDRPDMKQIAPVHNSHVIALSQACPDNLNGSLLTPLDLCDTTASTPDVLPHGYQGSHPNSLAISNQGSATSMLPTSGASSSLQGSPGIVIASNLSAPSGRLNASVRDGRFGVPRPSSLPVDDQQRMQQYNHMLSGRNIQQSGLSVPSSISGSDRNLHALPGGNSMGVMGGINRSMPLSRSGFQGMASTSMLGTGGMLSSTMVGMPSPSSMHSGAGPGAGNSMLRPHEALHVMRVSQGNSQGIPFNGLNSTYQTTLPSVQQYPGNSQQQHQMSQQSHHSNANHSHHQNPIHVASSQQQTYAIRLAKERQLQQRYMQQQHFSASSPLNPHVQQQSQLPLSVQNNCQIQQTSPQSVSVPPVTSTSPLTPMLSQHQQKQRLAQHGLGRTPGASGFTGQGLKQRQAQQQQFQHPVRNSPQQRQQPQLQEQAKLLKGRGRGSMIHQNPSVDRLNLNGLSVPTGSQAAMKGDQVQGQGLYTGPGHNKSQPSKALANQSSNPSQLQQKLHSGTTPHSSKQLHHMVSSSDNSTQGQGPPGPSGHILSVSHQAVSPTVVASGRHQLPNQPHSQSHQKLVGQNQPNVQRVLQHNRQVHSDLSSNKSQPEPTLVEQRAQPVNNTSQVSTKAVPPVSIDSEDVTTVVSPASLQWKVSEGPYDSIPTTDVGSFKNTYALESAGNEPVPPVSQSLSPRQLSGTLPSDGLDNTGAQWPQQVQQSPGQSNMFQQQLQPSEDQQRSHQKQQQEHSPEHVAVQHQPKQQMQHL